MKKILKSTLTVVSILAICFLMFFQLKNNKAENKEVAELANVKGRFYPVKTIDVKPELVAGKVSASGFLKSTTDLYVVSETQGRIVKIFKEKGDYVNSGDVIAKVDDELLQAQLAATKAGIEQLERDEARYLKLQKENAVTRRQLEDIQLNLETTRAKYVTATRQLEDTKIKAPVHGLINEDFIEPGQYIGGGSKICNIIDANNLKLNVKIVEKDLQKVHVGQNVIVKSAVYANQQFEGKVSVISQKAGTGNSFDVEILLKNRKESPLSAGMFVTTDQVNEDKTPGIYVPRRAINGSLKEASIYVVKGEQANKLNVVVGEVTGDRVEIIEGLKLGDEVIVAGNYNIYDGATVKIMN